MRYRYGAATLHVAKVRGVEEYEVTILYASRVVTPARLGLDCFARDFDGTRGRLRLLKEALALRYRSSVAGRFWGDGGRGGDWRCGLIIKLAIDNSNSLIYNQIR